MKRRAIRQVLLTVMLVGVSAAITLAKNVQVSDPARLGNGPELQPGTYRIELINNQDGSECLFYKGRNLVVRVPTKVIQEAQKSPHTALHSEIIDNGRVITQIRVEGWKEALLFERPAEKTVSAQ